MTEQKNALHRLFAACWKDDALKARFIADPKAVLAEHDIPVPEDLQVKVVENADDCVHITMPARPADYEGLSDEELSNAAGGKTACTGCASLPANSCHAVCAGPSVSAVSCPE
jgi:hypothetical protein